MKNELRQRVAVAASNLTAISNNLALAHEDAALLDRLKSAEDRVARLTKDLAKARSEHEKALAEEAKADKAARFAGISDVRVTESPDTIREHVLRASYTIQWTKLTSSGGRTWHQDHSVGGFSVVPLEVLEFIIEKRPELIPAKIMALAPDCPKAAFNRYFVSRKRGYVRGNVG